MRCTKTMLVVALLMAVSFGLGVSLRADPPGPDPSDLDRPLPREIHRMLVVCGEDDRGALLVERELERIRPLVRGATPRQWREIRQALQADADGLIVELVPLYERRLSLPTIEAALRFYETPQGRELVRVLPEIMAETVAVQDAWRDALQEHIEQELANRGLNTPY